MLARVRKALDAVQEVLENNSIEANDLWAILTALRSSDVEASKHSYKEADKIKWATTAKIRSMAFPTLEEPKACFDYNSEPLDQKLFNMTAIKLAEELGLSIYNDGHFFEHFHMALAAINRTEDV